MKILLINLYKTWYNLTFVKKRKVWISSIFVVVSLLATIGETVSFAFAINNIALQNTKQSIFWFVLTFCIFVAGKIANSFYLQSNIELKNSIVTNLVHKVALKKANKKNLKELEDIIFNDINYIADYSSIITKNFALLIQSFIIWLVISINVLWVGIVLLFIIIVNTLVILESSKSYSNSIYKLRISRLNYERAISNNLQTDKTKQFKEKTIALKKLIHTKNYYLFSLKSENNSLNIKNNWLHILWYALYTTLTVFLVYYCITMKISLAVFLIVVPYSKTLLKNIYETEDIIYSSKKLNSAIERFSKVV